MGSLIIIYILTIIVSFCFRISIAFDCIKYVADNGYKIDGNTKRGLLKLENDLSVLNKRINKVLLLEVDKQIKLMNR